LIKEDPMIGAIVAKKAIAGAFEDLDRHDLAKFMSAWREDGVFIYPGEIPQSGTFKGKNAVETWFRNFLEQFPKIHFDIQDICVKNIFAFTGTNVVAVHWNIYLTNRNGRVGQNSGVTVITVEGGKVTRAKDYIFDLGENFRLNWS
jgi:ketosteroid isomerase-like protein